VSMTSGKSGTRGLGGSAADARSAGLGGSAADAAGGDVDAEKLGVALRLADPGPASF